MILAVVAFAFASRHAVASTPIDPPRGDARIVVFGDINGAYGSLDYPPGVERALAAIVEVWRPDLLLSPGDVVAGQSHALPDDAFPAMWAAFDAGIAAPLRRAGIPYAVAPGNHDASSLRTPSGAFAFARERAAAEAYGRQAGGLPDDVYLDRSAYPFDYAFAVPFPNGGLFVAVLDASSATVDARQRAWLAGALQQPTARSAAFRIVVGHLPLTPVAVGRDRPGEFLVDADALRALLEAGGVDLFVSGHHAAYFLGRLGDLEVLFAGGVGGRKLLGFDAPARSTVSVLDLWFEPAGMQVTTFDLADMSVVPIEALPPRVGEAIRSTGAHRLASAPDAPGRP